MLALRVSVTSGSTGYSTWVYDADKSTTQYWLGSSNSYSAYSTGGGTGAGYITLNTWYGSSLLLNVTSTGFEIKHKYALQVHYLAVG